MLDKYCTHKIPSVSTLRRTVPYLHEENLIKVREEIGEAKIWMSIDEATDSLGRNIANVVIGKLVGDCAGKGFLIHVSELEKTNASTIVQTVQEALRILWNGAPEKTDKLLYLVTDSAAYMLKAGKILKMLYPKLLHSTCLSHGLHRVAEAIREEFPRVNKLIANGKKIFIKAPKRIEEFKIKMPGVPLPPEPVITRWGSWLNAAFYYFEHLDGFKCVIRDLDENSAALIKIKTILQDTALENELLFIKSNFSIIPSTIESLQKEDISVISSVEKIQAVIAAAEDWPGKRGQNIREKLKAVLQRNCGWDDLINISAALKGQEVKLPEGWCAGDALVAKYIPGTSADVERSFSKMKYILSDRR